MDQHTDLHFSPAQLEALEDDLRPTLLLAVPGSGKTTVLVARTARLLELGIPAERICSLTFSREAARDMRRRFQELYGGRFGTAPVFSTIHSLCWRILRDFSRKSSRPLPALTGTESDTSARLVQRCAEEITSEIPDEEQLNNLLNKIGLCKNRMLSRYEIVRLPDLPEHFLSIFSLYEEEKKKRGLMDYDDLLLYTLDILKKRPRFLEYWQRQFLRWNIDEGQDLSPVQYALLEILCPEGTGLFVVGDEDQSIYSFRGAEPDNLLRFPERYPNARLLKMEENRRSRPEILSFCEHYIRSMPDRYDKWLRPTRPAGGTIERVTPKNQADLLETLKNLCHLLPAGQTAGLLYRNNISACLYALYFRENNIPFQLNGEPVRLLRNEAGRMAALLAVCADPYNLDAFYHSGCRKWIGPVLYENVFLRADGTRSVPELLKIAAQRLPHRRNAIELAETLEACHTLSPLKALQQLEIHSAPGRAAAERWKNPQLDPVRRLRCSILRWLCETSPDFPTFFARLQLAMNPAAFHPEEAALTLSTIHSAKGLEFDTAILADCYDGILPTRQSLADMKDGESAPFREEQRLFYVAVTRAKEHIILLDPPEDEPGLRLSRFGSSFLLFSCPAIPKILFHPGEKVHHAGFGNGTIVKQMGNQLKIRFSDGTMRNLSLNHCMQKNLIARLP